MCTSSVLQTSAVLMLTPASLGILSNLSLMIIILTVHSSRQTRSDFVLVRAVILQLNLCVCSILGGLHFPHLESPANIKTIHQMKQKIKVLSIGLVNEK